MSFAARALLAASAVLFGASGHADSSREGNWRYWDQPGRGDRFIARTPSEVFSDSHLLIYFDARKNCAAYIALSFLPAETPEGVASVISGQHIELRVDDHPPHVFRTATVLRAGETFYFLHPLPDSLLEAIAAGARLLARSTLAPQIDSFSLRGSAVSIEHQRSRCHASLAPPPRP